VRRRFRLPGPFVLYPAITYPHKNHVMLIEAFALLRATHPDAVLVLTGGAGSCEPEVATAIERCGVGRSVRRLGRVSRSEVDGLFAAASAVAYPSRYEGFGLPVLEALGAGTPVVAADAASMPEVLGGAGQLVDPDDPEAWAAALGRVLDRDPTVQALVDRGLNRAQESSWDKLMPVLVDIYRRTASFRTDDAR
jgi:alpha-1,3-rhamnosyl/mannosyltransferase